jgi:hypothetical protein
MTTFAHWYCNCASHGAPGRNVVPKEDYDALALRVTKADRESLDLHSAGSEMAELYDALAAELASAKTPRKGSWSMHESEIEERDRLESRIAQLSARCEQLQAALRGLRDLCEAAGMPCDRANALLTSTEPPVSTLCAICDQIKEFHPASHSWTAKSTAETIPDWTDQQTCRHQVRRKDCAVCSAAETKADECCPKCDSEICICGLGSEPAGSEPKTEGVKP